MEYHPDYAPGRQVALSLLGALLNAGTSFPKIAPFASSPTHLYFAATGYSLFGASWLSGRPTAASPCSVSRCPRSFRGADGRTHQLFERAEFVLYDEFGGTRYNVMPQPLGYQALKQSGLDLPLGAYVELLPPQIEEGRTQQIRVYDQAQAEIAGAIDGARSL